MPAWKLISDCGSTKSEWCLVSGRKTITIFTQGISPYFLNTAAIAHILSTELKPFLGRKIPAEIHYYGTGCLNPLNKRSVKKALSQVFPQTRIEVDHDLTGAARALCGREKGIACILGTGSNSCYYNGKKIVSNSPGLGYVLGDEGSGSYLGKRVLQYYLYHTFDEDIRSRFDARYVTTPSEILDNVYKQPLANRYLAGFARFLADNRGHFMIENIIEDGLNDFFFYHLCKYRESWTMPIHFVGGVAWGFKDVIEELASTYEFTLGKILRNPMEGLLEYHR
jgi:N-acetylglucosamine kinase-like BadF-type ATPase